MKRFTLQIPEPCHEDWGKMTPNERGRFCASCAKTVVDFTKMNKEEIADYFLKNKNVCGNINESQLQQTYGRPSFLYETVRRVAVIAGLSLAGLQYTQAQTETPQVEQLEPKVEVGKVAETCETKKEKPASLEGRVGGIQAVSEPDIRGKLVRHRSYGSISISGIVYEDKARTKPLENAIVMISGTNFHATTNKEGKFSISGQKYSKRSITLEIQKENHEYFFETYQLKRKQGSLMISEVLPKTNSDYTFMGSMVVGIKVEESKTDSLNTEIIKRELFD